MAFYSKLLPSDNPSSSQFGRSIAMGNGKVVVGAPLTTVNDIYGGGAVYIYNINGTGEVKISASDLSGVLYGFGSTVAIGSNRIAVGTSGGAKVYLYYPDGSNEVIVDPNLPTNSEFGQQGLLIHGDKLYVGASGTDFGSGSVYIYELSTQNLIKILRPDSASRPWSDEGRYGWSLAAGNGKLIVGAPLSGSAPNSSAGRVYVYDLDGNNEVIINASDLSQNDFFGHRVAISDGRIYSAAWGWHPDKSYTGSGAGAAYSYDVYGGDEKIFRQDLAYRSYPTSLDSSGYPEAISDGYANSGFTAGGGKIFVGCGDWSGTPYNSSSASRGAVFIHEPDGSKQYYFNASDGLLGDHFGESLSYDNGYLAIGCPYGGPNPNIGYAYVFESYPPKEVKNLSGNTNSGTITDVVYNAEGNVEFNRASAEISVGTNSDWNFLHNGASDWTVEYWINPNIENVRQCILSTGGNSSLVGLTSRIMESGPTGSATGYFASVQISRGVSGNYLYWDSDPVTLSANLWQHITLVFKTADKSLEIYLNSNLANGVGDTGAVAGTFTSSDYSNGNSDSALKIGRDNFSGLNYNGKLAELRMYNGALTAAQISKNFNATRAKYGV